VFGNESVRIDEIGAQIQLPVTGWRSKNTSFANQSDFIS